MVNINNNGMGSCSSNSINTRECNGYWIREASRRRRIRLSPMFIDKLEFTVNSSCLTKSEVLTSIGIEPQDALVLLRERNIPSSFYSKYNHLDMKFHKYKRYKLTLRLSMGINRESHLVNDDFTDEFHLHLSAVPRNEEQNFIRISVNANNVEWSFVAEYLESILGECIRTIMQNSSFSTIETAIDILGCNHANLHILGLSTSITKSYLKGTRNFVFGGEDSHRKYTIYDKFEDIKRLNRKRRAFGRQQLPIVCSDITRVEIKHYRSRDKTGINFDNASDLAHYFECIDIYNIPRFAENLTHEEQLMLRLAKYESLKASIGDMSYYLQNKFKDKLDKYKLRSFSNIDFNEQLCSALDRIIDC